MPCITICETQISKHKHIFRKRKGFIILFLIPRVILAMTAILDLVKDLIEPEQAHFLTDNPLQ